MVFWARKNICSTSSSVKQGGVLSPILFCIYVDELLLRLSHSGYGCKTGHLYYGAVGDADDVALVTRLGTL